MDDELLKDNESMRRMIAQLIECNLQLRDYIRELERARTACENFSAALEPYEAAAVRGWWPYSN